jgi:hypothetical protein
MLEIQELPAQEVLVVMQVQEVQEEQEELLK